MMQPSIKLAGDAKYSGSWRSLVILSILMSFASISTDLYLPAMPAMQKAFNANPGDMEFTISSYLVGFSIGQLVWGPISDRFGRRLPIMIGLVFFIIGSAGCALASNMHLLIVSRVIQAIGACASVVLSKVMVHDLYAGPMAARMMSILMTVMAITPLLGPSVGGLILHLSSWRAIFICLVIIGILMLSAVTRLPETLATTRRSSSSLLEALVGYLDLVKHRRLMVYVAIGGSFYGAMFAYVAGTPHAYISYYNVSPQNYGLLFALGIVGIMLSNQINSRLVVKFGIQRMIRFGTWIAAIAGIASILIVSNQWFGLCGLVISLFIFVSATGLIVANSLVGAMTAFSQRSGAVSGLVGATQYGTGVLGSACVGIFSDGSPLAMVCTIAVFTTLSLCFSLMLKEPYST